MKSPTPTPKGTGIVIVGYIGKLLLHGRKHIEGGMDVEIQSLVVAVAMLCWNPLAGHTKPYQMRHTFSAITKLEITDAQKGFECESGSDLYWSSPTPLRTDKRIL